MSATGLPVTVGIDGTEPSLRAVDWAADEAALRGAPLRLVHASLWERYEGGLLPLDPEEPYERMRVEENAAVAERRARLRHPDATVTSAVFPEDPESVLVRESATAQALVLGCRGRGTMGRAFLGSVSLGVAGHAHCPVIVVRGGGGQPPSPAAGRIALGVDAVAGGSAAARFALDEAALRGTSLRAVRVRRRSPLQATAGPARADGGPGLPERPAAAACLADALRDAPGTLEVDGATVEGHPRDVLLAVSREADLIVVGTRRRHGHTGVRPNGVAHALLLHASCPVAVVPEHS
ncbi:universal stress protein [Streptomyces sp. DSM 41014]|uniref:Universal stress protein n=1 Tax=Streptomyces hintoniae TaxID=3075521 RepID=A0ABU2UU79_9ACTN|nr:universal stress protein [Streptomyces sp. DSM 41014]MDT0476816.1 universal stress protein [Streptomyces sp. DSM 41014]